MSSFKVLASNTILFIIITSVNSATITPPGNFSESFDITWGRASIINGGQLLTLTLDKSSGSGFVSKGKFLYGRFDMQIKLVPGNSAGTVTTYYLSSEGPMHDEIDLEFLGNSSGNPYTLHTNVFSQGKGNREQQFRLWFDPTTAFHTYSILWNRKNIVLYVNNIPIRVFNNLASSNVPYPSKQPMRVYSSLWNADDWATQGGLVKTDWSEAPFSASYKNFKIDACTSIAGKLSCEATINGSSSATWLNDVLDEANLKKLRWVQQKYMIYNYCADLKRYPQGLPVECRKIN